MIHRSTPAHDRQPLRKRPTPANRAVLAVGGSMISLFGVGVAIASYSLAESGDFFLFAGFGLIVSGALLAKRHVAGAWAYMAVFAATLAWALQGAGLGGSPIAYRITGPIVMLVMIAVLMPLLSRWSRTRTITVLAALTAFTVMAGTLSESSPGPVQSLAPAVATIDGSQFEGVQQ